MSVSQPQDGRAPGELVLERSCSFSSSHRYWRPEWSAEKNRETFGKCSTFPAHGHNYRLTVRVSGTLDPETGFLVDLSRLDAVLREKVVARLDHAHINEALVEFGPGAAIPTTENLVLWIAGQVTVGLAGTAVLEEVRLAEDEQLAAVWARATRR